METVGIIPVKAHSVRFPDKNFKQIAGRYLINIAVQKLQQVCDEIFISTDAPDKVEKILMSTNKVTIRPEIKGGYGSSPLVVKRLIEEGTISDAGIRIILSQVTSPLWNIEQLRDALDFFESHYPSSLVSLVAVTPDFKPCGAFYLIRKDTFEKYRDLANPLYNPETYLYTIGYASGIDIDYEHHLHIAEAIQKENVVKKRLPYE